MVFFALAIALLNLYGFLRAVGSIRALDSITARGKADLVGWNLLDILLTLAALLFLVRGNYTIALLLLVPILGLLFSLPAIARKIMEEEGLEQV